MLYFYQMRLKILFPLLLLLVCGISRAQFQKGTTLWGLQTNLAANDWYTTSDEIGKSYSGKYWSFNLIPTFGYALTNHWVIGGEILAGFGHTTDNNAFYPLSSSRFDFALMPYARYYVNISRNQKFRLFGRAAMEFIFNNEKFTYSNTSTVQRHDFHAIGALGGGLAYFGKRLSADLSMSNSAFRFGIYRPILPRKK